MATSLGVPLKTNPPRAGVEPLVVLADDDEIDVLGLLVLERAEALVVEFRPGAG
jgi:hypothetical protein